MRSRFWCGYGGRGRARGRVLWCQAGRWFSGSDSPLNDHMKKNQLFALAFAALTGSANASYFFSVPSGTAVEVQPPFSRVMGVQFVLDSVSLLGGVAIYDHLGDGWTPSEAKTIALYRLSGGNYSLMPGGLSTLSVNPVTTTGTDLVSGAQFRVASLFPGLGALASGTYFIGMSEVKPVINPMYDGYVRVEDAFGDPAPRVDASLEGLASYNIARLSSAFTTMPASFTAGDFDTGGWEGYSVIPSLVRIPEAGSSVMALTLGCLLLRFRGRGK